MECRGVEVGEDLRIATSQKKNENSQVSAGTIEGIFIKIKKEIMFKPGGRLLKDITDQELNVIVELSRHYGNKDYWGNFVVTRIDRKMFSDTIVIEYEQHRLDDEEKFVAVMFFNYNALTYHVDYRKPYRRQSGNEAITSEPKMLLWLLNQDFDLLSMLTERPVSLHYQLSDESVGYIVTYGFYGESYTGSLKFFGESRFAREDAEKYIKEQEKKGEDLYLYQLVNVQKPDREFSLKDNHYHVMEHCIGLDHKDAKEGLYNAYRNSVIYNKTVPEWEDLVRNGYARRGGDLNSVFYSLTKKGFDAVAYHNKIRIRYEIEVG